MENIKIPWYIYPVFIGFAVSVLVSGYMSYRHSGLIPAPVQVQAAENNSSQVADTELILERNVFDILTGQRQEPVEVAETEEKVSEAQEASAPPPANVELLGIMLGGEGEQSVAVMSVERETFVFIEGETINGVELSKLGRDYAMINVNGRKSRLNLYDRAEMERVRESAITISRNDDDEGDDARYEEDQPSASTDKITIPREDFVEQMGDINSIIKSVLMRPYERGGELIGYRLTRMRKDSVLRRVGLQNGDVLMRINGQELKTPEVLFGMMGSVEDISAVTLDIERKGEKKTIFVEIN
ncbi:type II secretion system protein N [Limisalsivibrio acetivorans]|uniref:type II secretion system protein N n=1 Tax=Limisalsivibrio acetivorans TaxID=1304888 RepID=UPI0003B69DA4|nr:type II secretion system protein N [Limisalsivibrio acetivorans]